MNEPDLSQFSMENIGNDVWRKRKLQQLVRYRRSLTVLLVFSILLEAESIKNGVGLVDSQVRIFLIIFILLLWFNANSEFRLLRAVNDISDKAKKNIDPTQEKGEIKTGDNIRTRTSQP
jgi:hypothetical protein